MDEASADFRRAATSSRRELERILVVGETPDADALAGFEYRGFNHSRWTSALRIRKFLKTFFRSGGALLGCNSPVVQDSLDDPWVALPNETAPKRFAYFGVGPVDAESRDNRYLHAILFDYGRARASRRDPSRLLRDYVVRVEPGSDDLLLGKAYVALGPFRTPLGFFVLERRRRVDASAFEEG
jgi:hypothetical protein